MTADVVGRMFTGRGWTGGDVPTEHRHVAVAFTRIRDLDRLSAADRAEVLQRASVAVGEACAALDVCWVETDVAADGATIVFAGGVPQQHDDDELRVVAAARRIADGDLGGRVSIGVHRGTAFVGEIGHTRRRTFAVTGLTTITAARLASEAAVGTVLASADVIDRLQQRYDAGPEQELAVKGRRHPVRAALIQGLAAAERSAATASALVGRRAELATLAEALAAHRAGRGSVIEVVGPPGIGKSHLLQAFLDSAPTPRVMVGGELALGMVPFGVLASALRRTLGAADAAGLRRLVDTAGVLAPLIGPVLGVDIPATDASRAVEPRSVPAARAELVSRLLRQPAGLLVVDDVNWLDTATVELLGAVVDSLAADGWLIVVTRRQDTPPVTPGAVPLMLEPLTDDVVGRLAVASGDRPLSDARLDAIVQRSGGNTLFAVQLARSTDDVGDVGDVGLPESAERVVGARIDLLPGELRRRLRRTSVLGRSVELDVLQDVIDDPAVKAYEAWAHLDEFVRWSPTQVEFRHELFRLAAYEGLSFADRSRLHRRAVDLLEGRPGTPAAVLAEDSRCAGRHEDVVRWATQAADEAAAPAEQTAIRTRLGWLAFRHDDLHRARRRAAAALRHLPADSVDASMRRAGHVRARR